MENKSITFSEIELAGDVMSFISFNSNSCSEEIKKTIFSSDEDELFKVTKKIASPIQIINVEKVDDNLLEKAI